MDFEYTGDAYLLKELRYKVGIIGSRNVKSDILDKAATVGLNAAESGYIVVTGMADGVDTWAMIGALFKPVNDEGLKNQRHIAIIPSIDYDGIPKHNHVILEEIVEKGGLIIAPKNPLKDYKTMYIRRNDLLLYIINELITVGPLGKGASYTLKEAKKQEIKVTEM